MSVSNCFAFGGLNARGGSVSSVGGEDAAPCAGSSFSREDDAKRGGVEVHIRDAKGCSVQNSVLAARRRASRRCRDGCGYSIIMRISILMSWRRIHVSACRNMKSQGSCSFTLLKAPGWFSDEHCGVRRCRISSLMAPTSLHCPSCQSSV